MFEPLEDESQATDRNTLVFRLAVSCEKPKKGKRDDTMRTPPAAKSLDSQQQQSPNPAGTADPSIGGDPVVDRAAEIASENYHGANAAAIEILGRPYTKHVYSSDLQWIPQGDQEERFASVGGIRPVHDDILIAKLRPGQAIELEAHARLGDGKDHAKYSPVATACYRLMPVIELLHDVYDDLADELDKYEPGVFAIVPCTSEDPSSSAGGQQRRSKKAVVRNPYACTMSRNYMRNPELKKAVKISRKPDHFIFSVEAVGMLPASTIVAESIRVLRDKCQNLIRLADESLESELLNK
jgi:DNA-directed RNA polymerase alpha subunit